MDTAQKDEKDFRKKLGKRVKELREARGLNQSGLTELTGLPREQLSRLENGIRRLSAEEVV